MITVIMKIAIQNQTASPVIMEIIQLHRVNNRSLYKQYWTL